MRIASVASRLPSRKVSNQDILQLVEQHSRDNFEGDLAATLADVNFFLAYSGSANRHWLQQGERPLDLIEAAVGDTLQAAAMSKTDIDLIIYTGISRGFIEPANAYHIARALDFGHVECFDVVDACMSWVRSVHLAEHLLQAGRYRSVLIVSAEFNINGSDAVFPSVFKLRHPDALAWSFPAFTLGEAAAAMILCADNRPPWEFHFASRPDLSTLCNIPLSCYEGYCRPSDQIAKNGVSHFTSFGFELHEHARSEAAAVFRKLNTPTSQLVSVFTHASSKRDWDLMAEQVGIRERLWSIYPQTGNLGSASVPVAMSSAIEARALTRGNSFAVWVGSAGMSFGALACEY